jgi:transaldolase
MPTIQELAQEGQAVWVDIINRALLRDDTLRRLIEIGVRGVTANPTILDAAIAGSNEYDEEIRRLALRGCATAAIYEALAFSDIGQAADLLLPLYEESCRADGFVSLEVEPALAYDTAGTINRARDFASTLNRSNVMIKVPATREGILAIEELVSEGININATLIFGLEQYRAVVEAYLHGMDVFLATGGDVTQTASVASFFVSRIDTLVDKLFEQHDITDLRGTIAVANARVAYAYFTDVFQGPRWARLAERGARVQRPLWASTSTKNPEYADTRYVDALIGPRTVTTLPLATLDAFLDHGHVALTLTQGVDDAMYRLKRLAELGIDMRQVAEQLTREGVRSFAEAFDHMFASIELKRKTALIERKRAA